MMRSLSSAVAGLRTHQTKMDVIGNNIANVNTYGFKSSRATFSDVYYQNLAGSKAGQKDITGGKNPTQIGYGASVATIDVMMNVSGSTTTDRALDVHITGEGFLVTKDVSGRTFYSRLGNMGFDAAGNLVDGNGYIVQGFPMKADTDNPGTFIPDIPTTGITNSAAIRGISCPPDILERMTSIEISPTGKIIGMLKGDTGVTYTGSANWINNLSIPTSSSYNGEVSWSVSALYSRQQMADALGTTYDNVREVQMGTIPLPIKNEQGGNITYIMRKNGSNLEIEMSGSNPPVTLVGTLSNNQIVFKNGTDVAMTVKLDPLKNNKISDLTPPTTTVRNYVKQTAIEILKVKDPNATPADEAAAITALSNLTPPFTYDTSAATNVNEVATNPNIDLYVEVPNSAKAVATGGVTLELYEQIKTYDTGGNTVIRGRNNVVNGDYPNRTDVPTKWPGYTPNSASPPILSYGDLSFTLGNNENMASEADVKKYMEQTGFNAVIASAKPKDETIYTVGQIVLAKFPNPSGLSEAGTSIFTSTNNSGEPSLTVPGVEGTGNTQAGQLEMSNVDISKEFTDMITTQRGFQANSRIVTVSDEMLQELVNLKR